MEQGGQHEEEAGGPLGGWPQGVQEGEGGVIPISDFLGKKNIFGLTMMWCWFLEMCFILFCSYDMKNGLWREKVVED